MMVLELLEELIILDTAFFDMCILIFLSSSSHLVVSSREKEVPRRSQSSDARLRIIAASVKIWIDGTVTSRRRLGRGRGS